ncbi:MAG: zinc-binding alcohol dehydrogenase [Planctomycetes bacterium]|nr:zinc-binding alcohol dehydrogenase [Planctomycetota bacterium]
MKGKRLCIPEANKVVLEDFEIDETRVPPDHVLIQTLCSLISPGTEGAIFSALDEGVHDPNAWCHYPFRPGYASVGRVLKAGSNVEDYREGDIMFTLGKHASIHLANLKATNSLKLPNDVDYHHVLLLRMAGVAITAVRVADFRMGDAVVVQGLGLVGNFAAQLFDLQGARVIGLDVSEQRLAVARMCGVRHLVNPAEESAADRVKALTNGEGAKCVVDAIGLPDLIPDAMALARKRGELVLLGSPRGRSKVDACDVLRDCHLRGVAIKGALEWLYPKFPTPEGGPCIQQNYDLLLDFLRRGRLKVEGLISHVLSPEDAQEAYDGLQAKKDEYLGVVFTWAE